MKNVFSICLIALACLSGCAENIREASPESIANAVKKSPVSNAAGYVWRAPELETRHYRTSIGGFDAIYYGLAAVARGVEPGEPVYEVWIKSNYGGTTRHYELAKFADGTSRALTNQKHSVERCQEFSNMTNACIYWDSATVAVSREELESAQGQGLKLILGSTTEDYEHLDFPANYIRGFLQAVH